MTESTRATWNSIVQRAVLGTDRVPAAPSPTVESIQSLLNALDADDVERALLSSAAIVGTYEVAGQLPATTQSSTIDPAPVEADDQPVVPERVMRFFTIMLGGGHDEVLPEWLTAVAKRGWRVPSPALPKLLERGTATRDLRSDIRPVLGARGRWLAAQNDDWSWAAVHPPAEEADMRRAWDTGTPDERGAILTKARETDAALGRSLLESTWETEAATQRAVLLSLMSTGLAASDEPFLDRALDDRRQEVRRAAAGLLRRLPASALVSRMTERARAAIRWKPRHLLKKAEVLVEPPGELDAPMIRDGIDKKPPPGLGERAWWLAQIIAAVPPSVWSNEWQVEPSSIIAAASASDWSKPLLEGLAAASVGHHDVKWAEALLATDYATDRPTPFAPSADELLHTLPIVRREEIVANLLRRDADANVAITLVDAADHAWSDEFGRVALAWLRKQIAKKTTATSIIKWRLRTLIPQLGARVPPRLDGATDNWPTGDDAGGLAHVLDRFVSILSFRRELAEELDR